MVAWRQLSRTRDKETTKLLGAKSLIADEEGDNDPEANVQGSASGIALRDLQNKLTRRNKGPEKTVP